MMIDCCQLLIAQHAETRRLLSVLESEIQAFTAGQQDIKLFEEHYRALVLDLKQHFILEEQGLFETVNQYRSMVLMEVEHDYLLDLQNALGSAVKGLKDDIESQLAIKQCFESFKKRLLAHMVEEEEGIFPLVQHWLEPEEQQKVLRRFSEIQEGFNEGIFQLQRPVPEFEILPTQIFHAVSRPIGYETLYEREHTTVQHLMLQAGKSLAQHWAGQHQCILVLSGNAVFDARDQQKTLTPGMIVRLDSRLWFSLSAIEDSHLVLFKVWPHPHFAKK